MVRPIGAIQKQCSYKLVYTIYVIYGLCKFKLLVYLFKGAWDTHGTLTILDGSWVKTSKSNNMALLFLTAKTGANKQHQ